MFDLNTRVLIADDMSTMRKIITKVLKEIGFTQIIEATDGALGWQTLSSANPPIGIVISDWNMPNCTGIDFLKRVRSDSRFTKLPFILLTAEAEQKQIMEAIKLGVSGYIVKPFTPDALKSQLDTVHKKVTELSKVG